MMGSVVTLVSLVLVYKGCMNWLAFKDAPGTEPPGISIGRARRDPIGGLGGRRRCVKRFAAARLCCRAAAASAPTVQKPGMNKWLFISLCLLYVAFPFDLAPDWIPIIGWSDDVVAIFLAIQRFMKK